MDELFFVNFISSTFSSMKHSTTMHPSQGFNFFIKQNSFTSLVACYFFITVAVKPLIRIPVQPKENKNKWNKPETCCMILRQGNNQYLTLRAIYWFKHEFYSPQFNWKAQLELSLAIKSFQPPTN